MTSKPQYLLWLAIPLTMIISLFGGMLTFMFAGRTVMVGATDIGLVFSLVFGVYGTVFSVTRRSGRFNVIVFTSLYFIITGAFLFLFIPALTGLQKYYSFEQFPSFMMAVALGAFVLGQVMLTIGMGVAAFKHNGH